MSTIPRAVRRVAGEDDPKAVDLEAVGHRRQACMLDSTGDHSHRAEPLLGVRHLDDIAAVGPGANPGVERLQGGEEVAEARRPEDRQRSLATEARRVVEGKEERRQIGRVIGVGVGIRHRGKVAVVDTGSDHPAESSTAAVDEHGLTSHLHGEAGRPAAGVGDAGARAQNRDPGHQDSIPDARTRARSSGVPTST